MEFGTKERQGCMGCLGLIVIIVIISVLIVSCGSDESKPKPEHDKIGAAVMAEEFIKKELKSPGSAKFPWYNDSMVTDLGNGKYRYVSYVDSQNGFGALLRTNFICTVKYVGDKKWSLESLDFIK